MSAVSGRKTGPTPGTLPVQWRNAVSCEGGKIVDFQNHGEGLVSITELKESSTSRPRRRTVGDTHRRGIPGASDSAHYPA
jgi:hypothetical protein